MQGKSFGTLLRAPSTGTRLEEIDKFSYLRGFLVEPAWSAIAAFALTSANYKTAITLNKNGMERRLPFRERTSTNC